MKIDPSKSKERYLRWQHQTKHRIPGLTPSTSDTIRRYLYDMERGINVAKGSKKGGRSYRRLNGLRQRMIFLAKAFQERFGLTSVTDVTEEQIHDFFFGMRSGQIRKQDGGRYRSTGDYVKDFKSFWHWHMKAQKKQGKQVNDICEELDNTTEKPPWVYLTHKDVQWLCNNAKYEYRVLMMFLYDSGIRPPGELINVKVSDLSEDYTKLQIHDEVSKTFGRTITLLLCPSALRDYIRMKKLQEDDYLFPICPAVVNRYLRRLATRLLGEKQSLAGTKYSRLTMYDFRHSSACYWLPRYKSESALKYRFGWKKSEMIHYYTEFLGMRDTITEDDLHVGMERTEIERRLETSEKERGLLDEQLRSMQREMDKILQVVKALVEKVDRNLLPENGFSGSPPSSPTPA